MSKWDITESGKSDTYEADQAWRVTVWKKVQPAGNWKGPIDAWIDEADFADCNEAAIWFAGSTLDIVERQTRNGVNWVRVQGPGYYANVGA